MKLLLGQLFSLFIILNTGCKDDPPTDTTPSPAYQKTQTINYQGVSVDVVIDKPEGNEFDVLLLYHGTVQFDSLILSAANTTLINFKNIIDRKDFMLISVAYPEENLIFGDNIAYAEAALLWVNNTAESELKLTINKVFLCGHSQGGYLVTRLNTMHKTNGVVSNAPGPLNLVYRCQLEETRQIPSGVVCTKLRSIYGTTVNNPDAYFKRSLLNFTTGFKSDILFVQGLNDAPIQMYSWPNFKQDVNNCTNCQSIKIVEIPEGGHASLFTSLQAKVEFNEFINTK